METSVEVFHHTQEIKIGCKCGNEWWVSGNIPVRVTCDSCKSEVGLRLALKMLRFPRRYNGDLDISN